MASNTPFRLRISLSLNCIIAKVQIYLLSLKNKISSMRIQRSHLITALLAFAAGLLLGNPKNRQKLKEWFKG